MKNESLVIMAGGASSRLKKSLDEIDLDEETKYAARHWHKSLIPLDSDKRPLLYFLLRNAQQAGIKKIYLITSENQSPFHQFLERFQNDGLVRSLEIHLAIQYVDSLRSKPLGTADAVAQCLAQFIQLKQERFTVCNGDNLYSTKVMQLLRNDRTSPHATIAYVGSALGFDEERLSKFAVMDVDSNGYLRRIIEKPKIEELLKHRDDEGQLAISMNIFNFSGNSVETYLANCPLNPERNEKELPEAVRNMVAQDATTVKCFRVAESLPDLTTAHDIIKMNLYF